MFTSAAKTLLKNHIRHADTHNRMVEESEMWATHSKLSNMDRKTGTRDSYRDRGDRTNSRSDQRSRQPNHFQGRNDSHDSFLYDDRDDSESPEDRCGAYMDRQQSDPVVSSRDLERLKKSRKTKRDLKAGKAGIDRWDHSGFEKQNPGSKGQDDARWGHSGYRMMYPEDSDSDDHKKRKRERYSKSSKKKKYKKRKKKRNKHDSGSEDEEDRKKKYEEEKLKAAEVNTKLGSLKQNSDLMLMQRFTSEVRPKKLSKPRMKMRTWNSDSSADSNSDSKYNKDKSKKHRRKKSRRKNYRSGDSSFDSSSDSDSETERRDVKGKRAKTRKKKRRHTSDETNSDSGEIGPSSKKIIHSSRTESTRESSISAEEYSHRKYPQKKYNENSDLTDDSDLSEKMKHNTDSDYSTARKQKKKKKHKHR